MSQASCPHPPQTASQKSLSTLRNTFSVNTFGPILLTQALLPNIRKSSSPKLAVVSSRVGSMADNSSGGQYAYRASKAAVNSLFKSVSVDLKDEGVAVLVLHPGIVKTALDAKHKEEDVPGAVEPEVAAEGLWDVLSKKGMESTGMFFHRSGEELPW
jgi:NAD(P)-dependent dehydrogenase (short-subunit alcohol dehydrogenase family)